jgi:protein tyrosine phosphatase (PTP) superfamily phosphohydrolase (DUF442 family)
VTYTKRLATTLALLLVAWAIPAHSADDPVNYIAYSATLASSGQPTQQQLNQISASGVARVIYLAFGDHEGAIVNEDRLVRDLGMQFIHIPLVWEQPESRDFEVFAAALNQDATQKTLVHCQINWRASSFVFLYRVLHLGIPIDEAFLDMRSIWLPNKTWQDFIFQVLEANGVSPNCTLCDWHDAAS